MAFIIKGNMHNVSEEKKAITPTPQVFKWNKGLIPHTEQVIEEVVEDVIPEIKEEIIAETVLVEEEIKKEVLNLVVKPSQKIQVVVEKYQHIKDGDLHRLINKKSGYLCDMFSNEE